MTPASRITDRWSPLFTTFYLAVSMATVAGAAPTLVTGEIYDTTDKLTVPARLYIQNQRGDFFFAETATTNGSAVRYDRQSGFNKHAIERHTALSAHPFRVALSAGRYTFTVERGKEYHPTERVV